MQAQGNVGYGFDVLGNVFACGAVAARCRLSQYAVAVEQADSETVKFRLDNVFRFFSVQTATNTLIESIHFGMIEHAVFILW